MSDELTPQTISLIQDTVAASVDAAYLRLKENGLNQINGRLDTMEGRLDTMEGELRALRTSVDRIGGAVELLVRVDHERGLESEE